MRSQSQALYGVAVRPDSAGTATPGPAGKNGSNGTNGTNGANGSPWTAGGVLPKGSTETGTWSFAGFDGGTVTRMPISFTVPLAAPLGEGTAHLINSETGKEIVFKEGSEPQEDEEIIQSKCLGSAAAPTAKEGNLCVYASFGPSNAVYRSAASPGTFEAGTATVGSLLTFITTASGGGQGFGTWAVTAE